MRSIPVVILLLAAFLAACQKGPVEVDADKIDPPTLSYRSLPDTVRWFLSRDAGLSPRIEVLRDLADTLALYGIAAEPVPEQEYRLGQVFNEGEWVFLDWVGRLGENGAAWLHDDRLALDEEFQVLRTHQGMETDSLEIEILGNGAYLESLTGLPCRTLAYPDHRHDLRVLRFLRDQDYLTARNGMRGYMPSGSFLLGEEPDAWGSVSLYETSTTLSCAEVQAVDPDSMAAWLAAKHLNDWIGRKRWVQLYTHTDDSSITGTAVLDTLHLGALLDALLATEAVWIAPVGEVAELVRSSHAPDDPEGLVWRTGNRPPEPWMGRSCAFSFSTDDGFLANLHGYLPCFEARGLSFTAFLNRHKIEHARAWVESPYMDPAEVIILSQSGVEIGNHGANHRCLLCAEALQLRLDRTAGEVTLEIGSEEGKKVLRLWEENATGEP